MARSLCPFNAVFMVIALSGCAHGLRSVKRPSAQELLEQTCSIGESLPHVKGGVWIKAKARDEKGQFPAQVKVLGSSDLDMEVTNLLGGSEAFIRIRGERMSIELPSRPQDNTLTQGSWAGIPLRWAPRLFLGAVPCPTPAERSGIQAERGKDTLRFQTKSGETYEFSFEEWMKLEWPRKLHWTKEGKSVDFEFENPEPHTRSPLVWSALSDDGEVKVLWRSRHLE